MCTQKMWARRRHKLWKKMYRWKFLLLAVTVTVLVVLFLMECKSSSYSSHSPHTTPCAPIDVVYTWVNGSDPEFIAAARQYDPTFDPARFDDKNELRYSLRSLEQHAPWVRHVYIVTNGQIPHWLDLNYDRVTVVPHEKLVPPPLDHEAGQPSQVLPTFSSAAIETFLHNIPTLSERFLYMNDDVFLGAALYPEDLFTAAEGVRIYQAWTVPDCAEDCPWAYIGDGACDRHCNIAACQFDGGDCVGAAVASAKESEERHSAEEEQALELQLGRIKAENAAMLSRRRNESRLEIRKFPVRKHLRHHRQTLQQQRNASAMGAASSFKEFVRRKNLTTLTELRRIVDSYNSRLKSGINAPAPGGGATAATPPRPPPLPTASSTAANAEADDEQSKKTPTVAALHAAHHQQQQQRNAEYKSSKDIFSHSLIQTNMLLNQHYGFKPRNVLAHVGFLLERSVINAMQARFAAEVAATASHRFRAANDLQFAFVYYSFLMGETRTATVAEIFDEFDTDGSRTWSDREVRTLLARMYPLPLDWSAVRFFEEVVTNCSRDLGNSLAESVVYSTLVYERYEDSNVPTITRELVARCPQLADALVDNFGLRSRYKYNINSKRATHSNFMMLTSNVSDVVDALDKMRLHPRKFNCINDNLEPQFAEENELIRHLLEDFYLSFFPRRSKFELQSQYRNRFANWRDYQSWRRRKRAALVVGYSASILLTVFLARFLCMHKAKFVRRYVQKL